MVSALLHSDTILSLVTSISECNFIVLIQYWVKFNYLVDPLYTSVICLINDIRITAFYKLSIGTSHIVN